MKKNLRYVAIALVALAAFASLPFDFACMRVMWEYPDFELRHSSVSLGSSLTVWPGLWRLRGGFVHAAWVSLAAAAGMVACRGREEREDVVVVGLACLASLAALVLQHYPFVVGQDDMLLDARHAIAASYAPLCYATARLLVRHLGRRMGLAMHLAIHVALVMLCSWGGAGYALQIAVPTVIWMALCWTLFALPVYGGGQAFVAGRPGGKGAKLALALAFALQVLPLSFWRVREIVVSLGFPAVPDPGYANYNWAVVRTQALAALPTASYRDLVADPSVLVGLRGLPLAWLGAAYGPIVRLAYAALLLLLLAGAYLLWRDARSGARGRMVEVLALGVLLSNLWGAVCSIFLLYSTGVVTLLSGNPFQLVPLVCLLALEIVPDGLDPFGGIFGRLASRGWLERGKGQDDAWRA